MDIFAALVSPRAILLCHLILAEDCGAKDVVSAAFGALSGDIGGFQIESSRLGHVFSFVSADTSRGAQGGYGSLRVSLEPVHVGQYHLRIALGTTAFANVVELKANLHDRR